MSDFRGKPLVYPDIGGYLLGPMGVHAPRKDGGIGKAMVWRAKRIAQRSGAGGAFLTEEMGSDRGHQHEMVQAAVRGRFSGVWHRMLS